MQNPKCRANSRAAAQPFGTSCCVGTLQCAPSHSWAASSWPPRRCLPTGGGGARAIWRLGHLTDVARLSRTTRRYYVLYHGRREYGRTPGTWLGRVDTRASRSRHCLDTVWNVRTILTMPKDITRMEDNLSYHLEGILQRPAHRSMCYFCHFHLIQRCLISYSNKSYAIRRFA